MLPLKTISSNLLTYIIRRSFKYYLRLSHKTLIAPQQSSFAPVKTTNNNNGVFGALKSAFFQQQKQVSTTSSSSSTRLSAATLEEVASSSTGGVQTVEDYVKAKGGNRVIRKVLIANNGMAATKSILSMRQWAYMT